MTELLRFKCNLCHPPEYFHYRINYKNHLRQFHGVYTDDGHKEEEIKEEDINTGED